MEIQLIRNATLRIKYAQQLFVIDPYFAAKHTLPSYTGQSPNPLVDLPCSPQQVIAGIEAVLVSHLHSDHFDSTAQTLLPKSIPLFCQPGDAHKIKALGFLNVMPIQDTVQWRQILITRTGGEHGENDVLEQMGEVSGFVFQAEQEPTVYWAGDTIYCDVVRNRIAQFQPQVIITHSCGAVWGDSAPIVMDADQTIALCQSSPASTVIATHMEALDHATVSRAALRNAANKAGIPEEHLLIPADGETLRF